MFGGDVEYRRLSSVAPLRVVASEFSRIVRLTARIEKLTTNRPAVSAARVCALRIRRQNASHFDSARRSR
jgi:hypothetical protein